MKKFIIILLFLILTSVLLITCLNKKEISETNDNRDSVSEQMNFMPDSFRKDFNMNPFVSNMNQGSVETKTFEVEDLFTERDLIQNPDLSYAEKVTVKDNSEYTIETEGIYVISGKASNFTIKVETEDKVQIVLNNLTVTNDNFPVIYVKSADKCFVTVSDNNELSVTGEFKTDDDINTDAVIFSKADLTLNGTGYLTVISASGNGITSKDDLKITGGRYSITSAFDAFEANDSIAIYDGEFVIDTAKDGFHSENDYKEGFIYIKNGSFKITAKDDGIQATAYMVIDGGTFDINAVEGLEATYIQINDGDFNIYATDDGINASSKSDKYDIVIEINNGNIVIVMAPGDTDAIDANGTIIVNGGTIDITGNSAFDADRGSIYNAGTIIINGVQTDSIPSSMMGGRGGFGGNMSPKEFGNNMGNQNGNNNNAGEWQKGGNGDHIKFH